MKLAMPVWQSRISPVFDMAGRLLIVETKDGREISRTEEPLGHLVPPRKVNQLGTLGVDVLICGAISQPLAAMVMGSGIELIPWIAGDLQEVLGAYLSGQLSQKQFLMPGCCARGKHHRFRGGGRHW